MNSCLHSLCYTCSLFPCWCRSIHCQQLFHRGEFELLELGVIWILLSRQVLIFQIQKFFSLKKSVSKLFTCFNAPRYSYLFSFLFLRTYPTILLKYSLAFNTPREVVLISFFLSLRTCSNILLKHLYLTFNASY